MEWKTTIHENGEKRESTSWQVLHTNWVRNKKWSEVTFTLSARWLHMVYPSATSHYPCFFSIIPIVHKQEACTWHLCKILCNAPSFLLLILRISSLDIIHHIKQQNIGPYQENKFKNVTYNFFLSLLGKIPRGLMLCCQYRNVHVHALKKEKKKVNERTRKKPHRLIYTAN